MREDEREKLVRNQLLFERANQSILDLAEQAHIASPVTFLCECPDEDCRAEIRIRVDEYRRVHAGDRCFMVAPGHDIPAIERVVHEKPEYVVVEKIGAARA